MAQLHSTPLLSLHVGQVQPLGREGHPSGIHKQPVPGPLRVTSLGLEGDAQADPKHHGGLDKALHHYPREHYARWGAELPAQAGLFVPGGFGENLSTQGLAESDVCLGDVFQLGSAVVQVSQGRKPCWKLNARFGVADMAQRVQDTGRTGWYYRVLVEGKVSAGEALTLVDRPCPEWPLSRLWGELNRAMPDRAALSEIAGLPLLATGWRDTARKRLTTGEGEGLGQRLARLWGK